MRSHSYTNKPLLRSGELFDYLGKHNPFNLSVKLDFTPSFSSTATSYLMEVQVSRPTAARIHSFLKQFALDVDQERLQHALPRARQIMDRQSPKPGLAFKVLLQELDHQIDWRFAAELEHMFLNA